MVFQIGVPFLVLPVPPNLFLEGAAVAALLFMRILNIPDSRIGRLTLAKTGDMTWLIQLFRDPCVLRALSKP